MTNAKYTNRPLEPGEPVIGITLTEGKLLVHGVTVRELFAGMAMQGFLSNPEIKPPQDGTHGRDWVSRLAVQLADALIEALNKPQETK